MFRAIKRVFQWFSTATIVDPPTDSVLFIGGPLDGEVWPCPPSQRYFICGDSGRYRAEHLGFEERIYERVFVWEGMHLSEALDNVLGQYRLPTV